MASSLGSLAEWVRTRPLLRRTAHAAVRFMPDVPLTIRGGDIGRIRIRLRRHRWMLWQKFGEADGLTFGMFQRLIRPGDVVYDIGANIGLYSRVMIKWFGAKQVIAFEPMRENFELLQANIALGGSKDMIRPHQLALSDRAGEEELQIDDMTSGTAALSSVTGGEASIGRREFGLKPKSERVSVTTLDALVASIKTPPPDVIKIDTEGAEALVLAGGRETIRQHLPRLCIALHGPQMARDTLTILDGLGYGSFGFVTEPDSRTGAAVWRQLHPADAELLVNNNIVASCDLDDVRDEVAVWELHT
jgi:FkbM family methyltransferase